MAGAGFRTFVDGDYLTAAQVNTYLMQQAVMVFADASARSTAIAAPSEGMVTYLTGTDVLEYYDGSSWVGINDADAIQNSIVDAKGDIIAATADNTPARLAVGTNEHRLVADSGETAGLKYVADTTNYAIGAKGDLLVGTAADTLINLGVGTDSHVLTADSGETSGLKWAAIDSGTIVQIVRATDTTRRTTTSTSFVDVTGMSVTITPTSASNVIYIIASFQGYVTDNSGEATIGYFQITDSSDVALSGAEEAYLQLNAGGASLARILVPLTLIGYVAPATTSAVTYKLRFRQTSSTIIEVTNQNMTGQMLAIEVAP